jgi:hypothetical protein
MRLAFEKRLMGPRHQECDPATELGMRRRRRWFQTFSIVALLTATAAADGANPTVSVTLSGNLRAGSAEINAQLAQLVSPNAGGTATFTTLSNFAAYSTRVDIFDSLHGKHAVYLFFFHDDLGFNPNPPGGGADAAGTSSRWVVRVVVDGSDLEGGTLGVPFQLGADGFIDFDNDGQLLMPVSGMKLLTMSQMVLNDWVPGTSITPIAVYLSTVTQFVGTGQLDSVTESASTPDCTDGVAQLHVGLTAIANVLARISKPRNSTEKRHLLTYLTRVESAVSVARSTAVPLADTLCFVSFRQPCVNSTNLAC